LKAELFSTDFIISVKIFLSILIIIGVYYENLQTDIYDSKIRSDMQLKAIEVADALATTSGQPKFWNITNVKSIGLFDSGKFNTTKFVQMKNMNYAAVKSMMGVGSYNLFISLKNESDYAIESNGTIYSFGLGLTNVKEAIAVKRLGIADFDGNVKKTIMEVVVWLKEG
jgi:hypothetical protein